MLRIVTPPATTAISLDEAKAHLRVDFADDDTFITALISAATIHAQHKTQRLFITQTVEWVLQDWCDGRVKLPIAPVAKGDVLSIKYIDWAEVEQTFDPLLYVVKTDGPTVSIIAKYGTILPIVFPFSPEPIVIQFKAGTAAADVPDNVKAAIKMIVGHLYENRDAVVVSEGRAVALSVPMAADDLLLAEVWN